MDGDILRQYSGKVTPKINYKQYNIRAQKRTGMFFGLIENIADAGAAVASNLEENDLKNFEDILKAEMGQGNDDKSYYATPEMLQAKDASVSLKLQSEIAAMRASGATDAEMAEKFAKKKEVDERLESISNKNSYNNFEARMDEIIQESVKNTLPFFKEAREKKMRDMVSAYKGEMDKYQKQYIQMTQGESALGTVRTLYNSGQYDKAKEVNQRNVELGLYSQETYLDNIAKIDQTYDIDFINKEFDYLVSLGKSTHEAASMVKELFKKTKEHDPGRGIITQSSWDAAVDNLYNKRHTAEVRVNQYKTAEASKVTNEGFGFLDEFSADNTKVDSWAKAVEIRDLLIQKQKTGEFLTKDVRGYITSVTAIEKALNTPDEAKVFAEVSEDGLYTSLHSRFNDGNLTPLDKMKMVEDAKARLSKSDYGKLMTSAGTPGKQYNEIETEYFKVFNSLETPEEKRIFEERFRERFEKAWDLSRDDATNFRMELGMFDAENLISNSAKSVDKKNGDYISPTKSAEYITDGMLYTDAYKDNANEHISNAADLITFNDLNGQKVMSSLSAGYIVADDETVEEIKRTTVGHFAAAGPDGTAYIMLDRGVDAGDNLRVVSLMKVDKDLNGETVLYPVEKDEEQLYFSTIKDELGNEIPQLFRQSVKNGAVTVDESLDLTYMLPGQERKLLLENPVPNMSIEEQEQDMILNKVFQTKRGSDGTVSHYDVTEAVTENKRWRSRQDEKTAEQNIVAQYKNPTTVLSLLENGSYSPDRMESSARVAQRYINAHEDFQERKGGMQIYEIQAHEDMMRNTFPSWNMGLAKTIVELWTKEKNKQNKKSGNKEVKINTKKKGLDGLTW